MTDLTIRSLDSPVCLDVLDSLVCLDMVLAKDSISRSNHLLPLHTLAVSRAIHSHPTDAVVVNKCSSYYQGVEYLVTVEL